MVVDINTVPGEWLQRAKASFDKTTDLDMNDVKNLAALSSYWLSNVRYEERQQARQERQRQHEREVQADTNS